MLLEKYHVVANGIKSALDEANSILIIAHKNPDGDTLGACLAFYQILREKEKNVVVFCKDNIPSEYLFLPFVDEIKSDFVSINIDDFDLVITLDCGADYMTGIHEKIPKIFGGKFNLINIDHHPSSDGFGKWNLVDDTASSTTLIIAELFQYLEMSISYNVATCLLCGIFTDTGSFQHSNTDSRSLRQAAFLMKRGAALHKISKNVFKTHQLEKLKLWGRVLSRAHKGDDGVTISHVSDQDFIDTHTNASDLSGVVDYLNSVPNSRFSLLLTENDGKVKASFRTLRDDIDVAKIAGYFGGGGHKKAAGFTLPGKLVKEVRWKVVGE